MGGLRHGAGEEVALHRGERHGETETEACEAETGTAREDAAAHIAGTFAGVIDRIPRPGTLLVAGGETLKALCLALGVARLDVTGQITPGLPRSTLRGGRWDGLPVVSKSGAFGTEGVWRDLLHQNGFPHDRSAP
ncbi:nucleotide-binding domain containing protein [Methylobacterium oryzae]|uniref:nucleotide-binding domain containing protein n=1 Tax=Methylobacterium oryzae TaxID=334852 RepID=UPI003AF8C6D5